MTGKFQWSPEVRYFRPLGRCQCGKPATGQLIGAGNAVYYVACTPCSEKALAAAKKARGE